MEAFMEDVLLPIAIQTTAVVMVHDTACMLANAFSIACLRYADAHGGQLPFTVMAFTSTGFLAGAVELPNSIAHKLKQKSKRWQHFVCEQPMKWRNYVVDLQAAATHSSS